MFDTTTDQMALVATHREPASNLFDRFGLPPFSVLDRRQGYWQTRRRSWLALGIRGELGRADVATFGAGLGIANASEDTWTSVFDPVITEAAYRWFCPRDGLIVDPFAGGSVRGIVAAVSGRRYHGMDLNSRQIEENRSQAAAIFGPKGKYDFGTIHPPTWTAGDSVAIGSTVGSSADFIFTCPPYGDLERYSDDDRDISAMPWPRFRAAYGLIVAEAVDLLAADRFAAVVVGDVRAPDGGYRGLVRTTIDAFEAAGASLYNQAVMIDPVGSASMRVGRQFDASRKLTLVHQHLLVFVKGDARKATDVVRASEPMPMSEAA